VSEVQMNMYLILSDSPPLTLSFKQTMHGDRTQLTSSRMMEYKCTTWPSNDKTKHPNIMFRFFPTNDQRVFPITNIHSFFIIVLSLK